MSSHVPTICPELLSIRPMRPRMEVRDPRSSQVLCPERILSSQCFLMMSAFMETRQATGYLARIWSGAVQLGPVQPLEVSS